MYDHIEQRLVAARLVCGFVNHVNSIQAISNYGISPQVANQYLVEWTFLLAPMNIVLKSINCCYAKVLVMIPSAKSSITN